MLFLGLTVDNAIVDIGNSVFEDAMSYVCLSRCRTIQGLWIMDLNVDKIRTKRCVRVEINRLRSISDQGLPMINLDPPRAR